MARYLQLFCSSRPLYLIPVHVFYSVRSVPLVTSGHGVLELLPHKKTKQQTMEVGRQEAAAQSPPSAPQADSGPEVNMSRCIRCIVFDGSLVRCQPRYVLQ